MKLKEYEFVAIKHGETVETGDAVYAFNAESAQRMAQLEYPADVFTIAFTNVSSVED